MLHRFSPLLLVLLLSLTVAARADAAPPTQPDSPVPVATPSATVAVDRTLAKLNALEDQLEAMTVKLDAATTKLDALTAKTHNIWETTHYTKGYIQNGIPTIFQMVDKTCNVVADVRTTLDYHAYGGPSQIPEIFKCP
jgi:hypothetical protein